MTKEIMNKTMTNYLLAIPYNDVIEVEGEETVYESKLTKYFNSDTITLEECKRHVLAFLIGECKFPKDAIPDDELLGLVLNFGMWDEKEVDLDNGKELVKMPFIVANAAATKLAFNIKKSKLVKGLDQEWQNS